MSDQFPVQVGLAPVAVRLPSGSAENQVITNAGPATVLLEGSPNNIISAAGSGFSAVTPGIPFPPGSRLRTLKNSQSIYANTTQLGGAVTSPPAVPATGVAATNNSGGPVAVTLSGGTVTVVSVSGTQVLSGTNVTGSVISVPAGGTITLTYSVAPTWTWNYSVMATLQVSAGQELT